MSQETDVWVGFDLGGTKMLATVYDQQFRPLGRKRKKTRGNEGAAAGLRRIKTTISKAIEEADVLPDQIAGIGVACPGPLDLDRGVIIEAPNLGWYDVHVKDALEESYRCPVVISNDVDTGVYGEYRFGAGRGARCVLGVFPGTGIGGGMVYEGRIFRARTSSCLELGHIAVIPHGPLCGCGRHGCLEAVASRLAICGQVAQAAFRGQAPHLLKLAGTDLSEIRSAALAESIKQGDAVVEQILREAARHIGTAVGSLVNVLAPDVVVLGGGLVEAMPEIYIEEVSAGAHRQALPSYQNTFQVVPAELTDDAAVMGAAAWVRQLCQADEAAQSPV